MKVLDLQCRHGHAFEGWFASLDDFEDQRTRSLVLCPVCNDPEVSKMPSAPRLNLGHTEPAQVPPGNSQAAVQDLVHLDARQLQAAWMRMVRQVMANTEDVGPRFAQEARNIHYGQAQERAIRGQASREETEALLAEGIEILPLPVPAGLKEPLQ